MRVERLYQQYELELRWTHFPLHPETPLEGKTLEELFAGRGMDLPAAKARMVEVMAAEGLDFGERTMTFNSRLAQELGAFASDRLPEIHQALFRAYFVEGKNLARTEVLIEAGLRVGLRREEMNEVLDGRRMEGLVDADWRRCHEKGVTGVPTFRVGDAMAVGALPYEQLEAFLLRAGAVKRSIS